MPLVELGGKPRPHCLATPTAPVKKREIENEAKGGAVFHFCVCTVFLFDGLEIPDTG